MHTYAQEGNRHVAIQPSPTLNPAMGRRAAARRHGRAAPHLRARDEGHADAQRGGDDAEEREAGRVLWGCERQVPHCKRQQGGDADDGYEAPGRAEGVAPREGGLELVGAQGEARDEELWGVFRGGRRGWSGRGEASGTLSRHWRPTVCGPCTPLHDKHAGVQGSRECRVTSRCAAVGCLRQLCDAAQQSTARV